MPEGLESGSGHKIGKSLCPACSKDNIHYVKTILTCLGSAFCFKQEIQQQDTPVLLSSVHLSRRHRSA